MNGAVNWPLLYVALVLLFLLPAYVAIRRHHPSRIAIIAVLLLFGWTVIGWAVAMIWSLTGEWDKKRPRTT